MLKIKDAGEATSVRVSAKKGYYTPTTMMVSIPKDLISFGNGTGTSGTRKSN